MWLLGLVATFSFAVAFVVAYVIEDRLWNYPRVIPAEDD